MVQGWFSPSSLPPSPLFHPHPLAWPGPYCVFRTVPWPPPGPSIPLGHCAGAHSPPTSSPTVLPWNHPPAPHAFLPQGYCPAHCCLAGHCSAGHPSQHPTHPPPFCQFYFTSSKEPSWMTPTHTARRQKTNVKRSAGPTTRSTDGETEARDDKDWRSITQWDRQS